MSYQLALLSRIVKKGPKELAEVLDFGISGEDFSQAQARQYWDMLIGYNLQPHTRGSVFTHSMADAWFKDNFLIADDMPHLTTPALCFHVRKERLFTKGNTAVVRFNEALNIPNCDPAMALTALHSELTDLIALGSRGNTDISLKQGLDAVRNRISLARQGSNLSVMSWPWEPLNRATFGIQPDDFIVLYGRPKSMKTWVLLYLVAWAFEQEKKILVYTKEMTPTNVYMRTIACILGLYYDELREAAAVGTMMNGSAEEKLEKFAAMVSSEADLKERLIVLSGRDAGEKGDTVSWLDSKISKYKPHMTFIDGMYLLTDTRKSNADHIRVMNISRDLRQLILHRGVPIAATMQANRKAAGHNDANLDEIAYSDALAQDATIAARVINDKTSPTISLVIGGSREFRLHGIRIHALPAANFSHHSELTEHDIQKAKEADVSEQEKKEPKKSKTNGQAAPSRTESEEGDLNAERLHQQAIGRGTSG